MVNLIEKVENMLEKNEKIISQIINQRRFESSSAYIFLTNKRIIYFKVNFRKRLKSIMLNDINAISYIPNWQGSGGGIRVLLKNNKNIFLTRSTTTGELEANDFIKEVRKRIK